MIEFDRTAVIRDLYESKEVSRAIAKMEPAELRDDLRQEMFVVLCELPEEKLQDMHEKGYIRWYVIRTMLNMATSGRSTFARTFRSLVVGYNEDAGHPLVQVEDGPEHYYDAWTAPAVARRTSSKLKKEYYGDAWTPSKAAEAIQVTAPSFNEELENRVNAAVGGLHFYESTLLKMYAQHGNNCRPVAELTGIPVRSVRTAVAAARYNAKKILRA